MTKQESILLSAYTGYMLTKDFADVQNFCEELLGRPVFTHEFAFEGTQAQIREKCKPLVLELIKNIEEEN
jgi:hypothetical protein